MRRIEVLDGVVERFYGRLVQVEDDPSCAAKNLRDRPDRVGEKFEESIGLFRENVGFPGQRYSQSRRVDGEHTLKMFFIPKPYALSFLLPADV